MGGGPGQRRPCSALATCTNVPRQGRSGPGTQTPVTTCPSRSHRSGPQPPPVPTRARRPRRPDAPLPPRTRRSRGAGAKRTRAPEPLTAGYPLGGPGGHARPGGKSRTNSTQPQTVATSPISPLPANGSNRRTSIPGLQERRTDRRSSPSVAVRTAGTIDRPSVPRRASPRVLRTSIPPVIICANLAANRRTRRPGRHGQREDV
jgi:hypothetical protein